MQIPDRLPTWKKRETLQDQYKHGNCVISIASIKNLRFRLKYGKTRNFLSEFLCVHWGRSCKLSKIYLDLVPSYYTNSYQLIYFLP